MFASYGALPGRRKRGGLRVIKLNGGEAVKVTKAGDLEVSTGLGEVKMSKPVAYQEGGGKREFVEVVYAVKGNEYGFAVGAYDPGKELVIDPAGDRPHPSSHLPGRE